MGESTPEESGAAEGSADPGDWDDVELDDVFVLSAERHEASGRARMLGARWKREAPEPRPWRSDEPPAGWIWSRGRRRKR